MTRPVRNADPQYFRLVTIRINRALLLMVPNKEELNRLIGGIVARYQEMFSITLFGYVFLSNHYHLAAQAPESNLWRFEQAINRELAKRINVFRGTSGHFWHRRYDEQIIPTEDDLLEALLYITCNPVSHGLVHHPKHWPGLNCYWHLLDEQDRVYAFTHYTKYQEARKGAALTGQTVCIKDFQTLHSLRISPLPQLTKLDSSKRAEILRSLIDKRISQIHVERTKQGLGFLGRKIIRTQDPFATPVNVKKSLRPICYTKNSVTRSVFKDWFKPWVQMYHEASIKFRQGWLNTEFPPFCFRPPLLYMLGPP